MDRILTGRGMKSIDTYTIQKVGIPSMVLMERAALEVSRFIQDKITETQKVLCICGTGNNGADAVAVARQLVCFGYMAEVVIVGDETKSSEEFNYQKNIAVSCNVKFLDTVTSIEDNAFDGCSGLTAIELPPKITSIGQSMFHGCTNLESINIPDGVTSIGMSAFYNCKKITNITLPNGVTSIGNMAFKMSGLITIIIPATVTSINSTAFASCKSLTDIYYGGNDYPATVPSGCTLHTNSTGPSTGI